MTLPAIAALCCVIWIYLLAARGGFWRAAERDDVVAPVTGQDVVWPRVVAIVPARDEASFIAASVGSLLRQDYRGSLTVIVVDDHSSDGTAEAARRAAAAARVPDGLIVAAAPSLPGGWKGKLWAMHHGIERAQAMPEQPEYLLLTDADIHHADDVLTRLVQRVLRDHLVLASLMAKLRCVSFAERALIPAFVFFFQMLYPFAWVNRADRRTAAAAGGCMLVQCEALRAAGGIAAIRSELIDDCALARLLKPRGPIWLGLTGRVESARAYLSVRDIRRMVARSAYAQLQYSLGWLIAAALAMIVTYVAPPFLTLFAAGPARWLGALAWLSMALAMQPILRFYRVSPSWGLALPAIAGTYLAFTLDSAWRHLRGKGGEWKGRVHSAMSAQKNVGQGR
jgi:hopene-associated glycosyltransferase HpnB